MAKIGLSLSGGGINGLAHIGVLKVLGKMNLNFSAIAGCSMGSIIGAAYAAGKTPEEMEEFILSLKLYKLADFSLSRLGIKKMGKFEKALIDFLAVKDFKELRIPLYINATNITEGKERIFSSGNLIEAIQASCAYPGVFAPLKIKNNYYIDGGVINNQPFPILPKRIKKFITVNITPKKTLQTHEKASILTVLDISIRIMQEEIADLKLKEYRQKNYTIIKPQINSAKMVSPEKFIRHIINSGELAALNQSTEVIKKFKAN
jgi:NTE family protein